MKDDRLFIDTNILVYAFDVSGGEKHRKALSIIRNLWETNHGVISTQVLQEFYVTVTGKIPHPMENKAAKATVQDLLTWKTVVITGDLIINAIEFHSRHRYSIWDSLIIASAIAGGAKTILSEDLADGQTIRGVTIKNPFR
jgi:predicted nucleic acid-binding protein